MANEKNVLVGGQSITTHAKENCMGDFCTIHNFSDHHMVKWKQMWDGHTARMFRICKHNVAHVDPDELPTRSRDHHCDGCCDPQSQFSQDFEELLKDYEEETKVVYGSVGPTGVTGPVGPIGVAGISGTSSVTWSGATGGVIYTTGGAGGTHLTASTSTTATLSEDALTQILATIKTNHEKVDAAKNRHRGVDFTP